MERQHVILKKIFLHIPSHKMTFTFINMHILTPWLDATAPASVLALSPWEVVETPLPPQERGGISTTSGDTTISSSLQKNEDHQLKHN